MTIQHLLQITISEVLSTLMHAVSVIIWESLVERGGKRRSAIRSVWVSNRCWSKFEWFSLNHHGNCDIVVIRWVLDFVSILLSNGLEGIITNNLSERFKGDGVDFIKGVGWGNLEGKSSLLIDWNRNELGVTIINLSISLAGKRSCSVHKMHMGSGSSLNLGHSLCYKLGSGSGC